MCILIFRHWHPCYHIRNTSTDVCITCLSKPGMRPEECPDALDIRPEEPAEYPCPICNPPTSRVRLTSSNIRSDGKAPVLPERSNHVNMFRDGYNTNDASSGPSVSSGEHPRSGWEASTTANLCSCIYLHSSEDNLVLPAPMLTREEWDDRRSSEHWEEKDGGVFVATPTSSGHFLAAQRTHAKDKYDSVCGAGSEVLNGESVTISCDDSVDERNKKENESRMSDEREA